MEIAKKVGLRVNSAAYSDLNRKKILREAVYFNLNKDIQKQKKFPFPHLNNNFRKVRN